MCFACREALAVDGAPGRTVTVRLQARATLAAHGSACGGGTGASSRHAGINGTPPEVDRALGHPSQTNAYELSQGKRLYTWFNCEGCHADGGGAFGPALMDGWWRYGPDPVSIFVSIREGRPRGMPAFANRLTTEQIWQLTGYIQSLGALSAQTAAPNRNDDMQTRPAENRAPVAADLAPPS